VSTHGPGNIGPPAGRRSPQAPGPFAVVSGFAGRRTVIPFALLVLALLVGALVALLLLNTALDQGAFELQAAQRRQTELTDQQQDFQQQLAALSAPGALASAAAGLGMVPDPRPVFLDPSSGAVLGVPTSAPSPTAVPSPTASSASPTATGSSTPTGSSTASPDSTSHTATPSASASVR
jgi:hypothetical protein